LDKNEPENASGGIQGNHGVRGGCGKGHKERARTIFNMAAG